MVPKPSISSVFPGLSVHGVPWFPFKNVHGPEWPVIIIMGKKLIGSKMNVHSIHWFCPNWEVCSLQLEYNTTKSTTTLSTHSGLDSLVYDQMAWNGILAQLPTRSVALGIHFIHRCFRVL